MKSKPSKLQIAQTENCVARLDKCTRMLDICIEMLKFANSEGQYNQLPDEFRLNCKKGIQIVVADLKSLKSEAADLALLKAEKASELRLAREESK